jgi:hypothetical protein
MAYMVMMGLVVDDDIIPPSEPLFVPALCKEYCIKERFVRRVCSALQKDKTI